MLLQHARGDEAVAYPPARTLYGDWCGRGVNAHFRDIDPPGYEHVTGGIETAGPARDFIAARQAVAAVEDGALADR